MCQGARLSNWVPWGQAGCHGFPKRRAWGSVGSRGTSVGFDGVEGDVKGSLRRVGGPSGLTGTSVGSQFVKGDVNGFLWGQGDV